MGLWVGDYGLGTVPKRVAKIHPSLGVIASKTAMKPNCKSVDTKILTVTSILKGFQSDGEKTTIL